MKYHFVYITGKYNVPGWWLKIDNMCSYLKLFDLTSKAMIEDALVDHIKVSKSAGVIHHTNDISSLCNTIAEVKEISFVAALEGIISRVQSTQIDLIESGEVLLFNEVGGYCVLTDSCVIEEEIIINKMIFPSKELKDVRYIQWNNGSHWYAKIGKLDIVVDGEQKWNTKEEAKEAAIKYFNNIK